MDLNRTTLTALALGFSIAAITAAPIPYSTTHVINEGDSPAVIVEKAAKVLPRPNQTAWMLLERTFFLHFGVNTFNEVEWGTGREEPALFNPSALDANQWLGAVTNFGGNLFVLVAKHHDGFCMWPTRYTPHSTVASPWRGGKGDLVRDVVWRRSQIEMMVHAPMPDGVHECVSSWGWPDEMQSRTWPGQEGKPLQIAVSSRCESVRLELNGKVIGEKPVSAATKLAAKCDVPYQPGELRAIGLVNGKVVAKTALKTIGPAKELRLTADRKRIRVDRNDLACVTVEVVDANGRRVPNAEMPVRFSVSGAGELADQASSGPNDATSFRAPVRKNYEGRCLVILRPNGGSGKISLSAEADGLKPATIFVRTR